MPDDERSLLSSWPSELCFLLELPCLAESMNLLRFLFPAPHCMIQIATIAGMTPEVISGACYSKALNPAPFVK